MSKNDMTQQDTEAARKTRTGHWSTYPTTKARRIDGYYKTHPTDAHARNVMVSALSSVLEKGRVLDVGCGTGDVTVAIHDAGYEVTGLDISKGMLEVFKENSGHRDIPLIIGDIFEMEPPDEKFDGATCRYVFSHYQDFSLLLKRIADYVRPGGYIIFDTFASESIECAAKLINKPAEEISTNVFGSLANFSDSELMEFCKKNNFTIHSRHSSSFFHRNPIYASMVDKITDYDAELAEHTNHPEVRRFMMWFQERIASKLPSNLSGSVINIIKKSAD